MGERGPVALENSNREDRNRIAVQQDAGLTFKPHPDKRWHEQIRTEWWAFLGSPVAKVLTDVDANALRRLFGLYHVYLVAYDALMDDIADSAKDALVEIGSQKQSQPSALLRILEKTENMIAPLETRFGITPLIRARLGIKVGQGERTAATLNEIGPGDDSVAEGEIVEM